jgi:L-gulonate 5-dehydrogenase
LDIRRLTLQEVTFIGTYTYSMVDFRETVAALASGQLGPLDWFEERPLAEGATAFDDLDQGRSAAAKIILRP